MKNINLVMLCIVAFMAKISAQEFSSVQSNRLITIDDAIEAVLTNNNSIKADSLEIAVQSGNLLQARLPENPAVVLESEEIGFLNGKVKDGSALSIDISQSFQPIARWKRTDLGKSEVFIARVNFDNQKRDLIAETKARFISALALQKQKVLTDSLIGISQRAHQVSVSQANAGKVSISDTLKTSTELSLAQIKRDRIAQILENSFQDLSAMWGSGEVDFFCLGSELDSIAPLPDIQSMLSRLSDSPQIKLAAAELKKSHSELALEKALRVPAVNAMAGVGMVSGADELTPRASLSLSIPFLNWNQGAIQAAKARVKQAEYKQETIKVQTQKDLLNVYRGASQTLQEVHILRQRILPQLKESFEASYKAYISGKTGVFSLIDAQQSLYETSMNTIEISRDLLLAIIELERISTINEPLGKPSLRSSHE